MDPHPRLDLKRELSHRRDDFVVGPANEAAIEALDAWPDWLGKILMLVGPEGSGKTHLARDWAIAANGHFLCDVEAELADLHTLEGAPVAVDDADRVDDETLFHLINQAGAEGGALLLTARTRPQAWTVSLPDLRSRLNALRVVEIAAPDDVVLAGVLRRLFEQACIKPSDETVDYLVRRIERSVPRARALVALLDAEHRPVTRKLAREVLAREGFGDDTEA
ncbi:MAG TPA: DnaA/Hda family protein [Caulobacteraceae bacterium]